MRKKELLLGMLAMATISLCACGSGAESAEKNTTTKVVEEQNGSTTKTDESTKDTTTGKIESNIKPVKEEEAVIYIDDVAIKIDQTYEEFEKLMKENNWTVTSNLTDSPIIPTDEDRSGVFWVKTNVGDFLVRFMENENNTAAVIRNITIYPNFITTADMDKFNLFGITLDTSHDEIKGKLELHCETPTGIEYILDDWLYITIWDTTSAGTSTIQVDRKIFFQRETE